MGREEVGRRCAAGRPPYNTAMLRILPAFLLMLSCGGPRPDLKSADPYERYLGAKALAETRDFAALVPLLEDRHFLVVLGALEAVAAIGEPHAFQHLPPLLNHPHPAVRGQVCATLRAVRSPEAIPVLVEALRDADPSVRREAVKALSSFGDRPEVRAALLETLSDRDPSVAFMAHEKLAELTGRRAAARHRQAWEEVLKDP